MRIIRITHEHLLILFFSAVIICAAAYRGFEAEAVAVFGLLPMTGKVIIVDAGHGGFDPGKVSTNGTQEKDINLKIAGILQEYLEHAGATVLITRNTDTALSSKKRDDFSARKTIVNESDADIIISIHQNSFPQSRVYGAQVFYHNSSKQGKLLAESIQIRLRDDAQVPNKREAKANTDYYILKTTKLPSVIVECGFLTNPEEEKLLLTDEYQQKIAWSIYKGVLDYYNEEQSDGEQERLQ